MKKQIYSFVALLMLTFACALTAQAQESGESLFELENAAADKFIGLEYDVPALNPKLKDMADAYMLSVKNSDNAKASRQLVVLMDTIQRKTFRERVNGWVSVGHYFVANRSEKAAKLCQEKIENTDKAPTQRYVILFCAEVAELCKDYAKADQFYKEALYINDNDVLALNRKAHVNKFLNSEAAIQDLELLLAMNPNDYNAYKNLGDIQYNYSTKAAEGSAQQRQDLRRAIEFYRKYFDVAPATAEAIEFRACLRYTQSLYNLQMDQRVADSLKPEMRTECQRIAKLALDLGIATSKAREREMNGYLFYCDVESENYDQARQHMAYITNKVYPDSLYSILDYSYAGKLENAQDNKEAAIGYYDIILQRDSTRKAYYDNITKLYRQLNRPLDAVPYQEKLQVLLGDKKLPDNDLLYARLYKDAIKNLGTDSTVITMRDSLKCKFDTILNKAINYYAARLEVDSVKNDSVMSLVYTEGITLLYNEADRATEGIPYYKKYLDMLGDEKTLSDELQLANLYKSASLADTLKREEYVLAADEIYESIATKMTAEENAGRYKANQMYIPWYYRAALWITDPAAAEEKPKMYYEKALELIGTDSSLNRQKEVCAQYLLLYYFKTNEDDKCWDYIEMILSVNPSNRLANQIMEVL